MEKLSKGEKLAKKAKPWKGAKQGGPTPARHIPWPEIFKHHLSVLEGHLRMLEMVQKHTVPSTSNHKTISGLVDRGQEMIHQFKQVNKFFAPVVDTFATVPLGSSSASMYPGYSPADHEYGRASHEAGTFIAAARKRGADPTQDPNAPQLVVGGRNKYKRMMLSQEKGSAGDGGQAGRDGHSVQHTAPSKDDSTAAPKDHDEAAINAPEADNPYFVIDTNPTPVNLDTEVKSNKRSSDDRSPPDGKTEKPAKKAKTSKAGKKQETEAKADDKQEQPDVQFEDISAEVEARLKEKEEKRKRKEEKKRRRESKDSGTAGKVEDENEVQAPSKKKTRASGAETKEPTGGVVNGTEKTDGDVAEVKNDEAGSKRKKRKKNKDAQSAED
ncbi:MAG: hypothetical protein M1817_003555 [Caeruleum heppii]|nr:MAG: hypothetical protein M1817_003555 [Caeruleum heppii]